MKIVIDLTSLADNFSGIERYALNISTEMLNNDDKNEYILLFKNSIYSSYTKLLEKKNVKSIVIQGRSKLLFAQLILVRYLYKIKADRYIFLAFPSPILFRKKGMINTIHDLTAWDYPDTMKTLSRIYFKIGIRNAIKVSKEILTVSKFSKKRIIDKFGNKNVNIVYNGVSEVFLKSDTENNEQNILNVRNKYGLPDKYLMCLCTLEPRKNIELLIKAYAELRNENKLNLKLVLVGRKGWKIENLLNDINNIYVNDIIITGFVEDEDLPLIYKVANCFIFPSLYEGFGIPVLEALHMGVPVIASDTSSIPEVLDNSGIMFKNNDKDNLKEKIIELLNISSEEINKISLIGKRRANRFRWDVEAKKLMQVIKD